MASMSNTPRDTKGAADKIGVKPATLEAWRCRGGGPRFAKIGRAVRYYDSDLDEFIEARKRTSTSEQKVA
jgi:predicted DNA-binding transcriptional regulator AlpA